MINSTGETQEAIGTSDASRRVEGIIYPEDVLPPAQNLMLGAQHVIAMSGSTVLAPLLMGFDPNTCVLFSGIATLIFFVVVRGKIPSYLGSSFSFIAPVVAATVYSGTGPNPNIGVALGGIIAAGLLYSLIGACVAFTGTAWLNRLMPAVVTGAIVAVIGLNLAPIAVRDVGTTASDMGFGLLTVALIVLSAVHLRGFVARIPILIGGLLAYLIYFAAGNVPGFVDPIDLSGVASAAWIGLPAFHIPVFDQSAIFLIAPVAFVLVAENLGHVRAIAAMTHRNLDPHLGRTFMADGLGTMISGFFGGTGVTTYAENMGVMSISKNYSSYSFVTAAVFAICLGLSPKFGALIQTVPMPIIGGLSIILFGLITATAGRIWVDAQVDFTDSKNLLVVGVAVVVGAGNLTLNFGGVAIGGIATATFSALILYHVIAQSRNRLTPLAR